MLRYIVTGISEKKIFFVSDIPVTHRNSSYMMNFWEGKKAVDAESRHFSKSSVGSPSYR